MNSYLQRFLLEDLDIRGAIVRIDSVWQKMLAGRNYPSPVVQILGEITATTLLLGSNLKQPGRLTVQLSGDGPISMLVIDCNESLHIRGMAKCIPVVEQKPLPELLGSGQLVLSLDLDSMREAYQSIVPLEGSSVTEIFEHYLKQSEQLNSRLFLAASAEAAVGIFLQKLPTADQCDIDGWSRIETLATTVNDHELLTLQSETLLTRLLTRKPCVFLNLNLFITAVMRIEKKSTPCYVHWAVRKWTASYKNLVKSSSMMIFVTRSTVLTH